MPLLKFSTKSLIVHNDRHTAVWEQCKKLFHRRGRSLDLVHARISLDYSLRLMTTLDGDIDIVIPAVLLHDIGNTAIDADDLEKRTINPGTPSAKKNYSTRLKQQHLDVGRQLSKKILKKFGYSELLIKAISEIVGDHENPSGGPPDDRHNLNKIIVSDADKLYRYSPSGVFHMCRLHDIAKEMMLRLNIEKISVWLITDAAKQIAMEELRKMPVAEDHLELMTL